MSVDIFLKLEGIKGEARDAIHGGEIDVLAWSWGFTLKMNSGGGGPTRAPEIEHIEITKYVDRASAVLMGALTTAKPISTGTLTFRKAGGAKALEYLKITMNDVMITSVRPSGAGGDERFTERVKLDFAKVRVTYQEQDDRGIAKGGEVEFEYNIKSNV